MAEYHITRKAVQDLTAIWEYTLNTWSESQADIYMPKSGTGYMAASATGI